MFLRMAAFGLALALALAPVSLAAASDTGYNQQAPQPGGVNYQQAPPAADNANDPVDEEQAEESTWSQAGLGVAAIGADFLYVPAKLIYGVLGLTTGSAGWALTGGDSEVATRVFTPSLRGTYVLTPQHLTGEDAIHFVGSSRYSTSESAVAGNPPPTSGGMVAGGDPGIVEEQF
jgi:hypothetical protein